MKNYNIHTEYFQKTYVQKYQQADRALRGALSLPGVNAGYLAEKLMNEADWLKKYYPIPANKVEGTDLDLLDHSIRKWEGLLDLEQYGLEFVPEIAAVRIKETCWIILFVDGESCALCKRHQKCPRNQLGCGKCPLAISLGLPCDQRVSNTDAGTFYHSLYNPQIMIDALKKAREMVLSDLQVLKPTPKARKITDKEMN